jgi:PhzF family phenazine biosynthesis protein
LSKEQLLLALGITPQELLNNHPIQIVSTGHSKVLIGIKQRETLHGLKPNFDKLVNLSNTIKCNGYYVYTINPKDNILIHGRMFAPAIGIHEDPVTGNANGPLGAYLIHHNLVEHNNSMLKFKAKQGEAIGRSGVIEVNVKIDHQKPVEVAISGNAVIVFYTELTI